MISVRYLIPDDATGVTVAYSLMSIRVPVAGDVVVLNGGEYGEWAVEVSKIAFVYGEGENIPSVHALCSPASVPDLAASCEVSVDRP